MFVRIKRWIGINPLKWVKNTLLMRRRVQEFINNYNFELGTQNVGVVITPWEGSSIPYYSLAVGLLLLKAGCRVDFIIDGHFFGTKKLRYKFVMICIKYAIKPLKIKLNLIELPKMQVEKEISITTMEFIKNLTKYNSTWEFRGERVSSRKVKNEKLYTKQFIQAYRSIFEFVTHVDYSLIFIPGGVWGISGIWSKVALDTGIRIGSYDYGGNGSTLFAGNGIACQLQDIPIAFNQFRSGMNEPMMAFARGKVMAEIDKRRVGEDEWHYQFVKNSIHDERYDGAVVVALNSSWDSAALGLHSIFKDNTDWVIKTVRHLLYHSSANIIVRQHPVERLSWAKSNDNYREILSREFGENPRIFFIASDQNVNSYELMSRISSIVVHTSTIGIEAVIDGLPVITASNSYYSELNFIYKANNYNDYCDLLDRASNGDLAVTPEMKDLAILCYYLTQCCNRVYSDFNPAQFHLWIQNSIDNWYVDQSVATILETLRSGNPIAFSNHRRNWNNQL